jgi:hypothetical protein
MYSHRFTHTLPAADGHEFSHFLCSVYGCYGWRKRWTIVRMISSDVTKPFSQNLVVVSQRSRAYQNHLIKLCVIDQDVFVEANDFAMFAKTGFS